MTSYASSLSGPQGNNHCQQHPAEPIVGMCGCGTLFCRQCSPSAVFCERCHDRDSLVAASRGADAAAVPGNSWMAIAVGSLAATRTSRSQNRLAQRILIEALLLMVVTVVVFGFVLSNQNDALSSTESAVTYGINLGREPLQRQIDAYNVTLPVNGGVAYLSGDAAYSVNAKVQSVRAYDDSLSATVPYDLLLAWGDMADSDLGGDLAWQQGNRQGSVSGTLDAGLTSSYVITHVSNSHVIPANDHIRNALATIRPGDVVKIDGRLVDVRVETNDSRVITVTTSKVRDDQGDGACEIILVEQIRINNLIYR